jgi:hypothetical protein
VDEAGGISGGDSERKTAQNGGVKKVGLKNLLSARDIQKDKKTDKWTCYIQ